MAYPVAFKPDRSPGCWTGCPDYQCDPAGAVHYQTIGVIQGMRHLPATFRPGPRLGPGLAETIAAMQRACDEQRLAEPVTVRKAAADLGL